MFRYLALVRDDADPRKREAASALAGRLQPGASPWRAALREAGLAVFCTGVRPGSSEVYRLQNDSGVVLGKLFRRWGDGQSGSAPLALDEAETQKILATRGRNLIDHYWGRYVAFLRDAASGTVWILHEPTAVLPCQTMVLDGVDVYFSLTDDAAFLAQRDFAVDWRFVSAALCHMRLQTHATGLQGITQVLGGECVESRAGESTRSFYWNALRTAETEVFEDPEQAAQALHRAARDCVQAWASCFDSILHTLSGGLDSSIVMACLQDMAAPPRITCLNYYSPCSDGDERGFARSSAQRAGQGLIEWPRNDEISFEPLLSMQRLSVPPVTVLYYLENLRREAELAAQHGATAIFSGNTGDQLFYQNTAVHGAGDYALRHGIGPGLFSVAFDAARMDRLSVWAVLRDALVSTFWGRPWHPTELAGEYRCLLTPEAISAAKEDTHFIHPWFRDAGRFPGGKLFHAYSMIFPPDFYTPLFKPDDPELTAPLFSQPLIEVLLRTPVYWLIRAGWDRATARRAFQGEVPWEIITRQTKGGMEEHAKAVFLRNISLVRELLLEGSLVREGILDAKKLREVLSGGPTRVAPGTVELFDYFTAEAWALRFRESRSQRAAA